MTDEQIKHMAERFLRWKLPADFCPDAGISFKAEFNQHTAYPSRHEPTGTNLLGYSQAEAMVRFMVEGLAMARSLTDEKLGKGDVSPGLGQPSADLTSLKPEPSAEGVEGVKAEDLQELEDNISTSDFNVSTIPNKDFLPIIKQARLYAQMKDVAEANGFDSLTDAIAQAVKARALNTPDPRVGELIEASQEVVKSSWPPAVAHIHNLRNALAAFGDGR